MELIDRETGLGGLVIRPLCAKLLDPTVVEQEGLIDRERLMDISGRSRRRQMELAQQIGLTEYPSPAGGCLLTDKPFAAKVKDAIAHEGLKLSDISLLKTGRPYQVRFQPQHLPHLQYPVVIMTRVTD